MRRSFHLAVAVALGLAALAPPARASTINFVGNPSTPNTEGLGYFSGSLTVTSTGADSADLTITITNELSTAAGGKITAIAFNNPSDLITGAILNPNPPPAPGEAFDLTFSNGGIDGDPFGDFDFVLSTGGSFLGGGSPNDGLLRGETGTFTIQLTGTGVGSLTALDFQNALSTNNGGQPPQFLLVRFRGFDNGGSDKVGAVPNPVPEPGTLALCGVGAAGLFGLRARRKKAVV